ncbi:MAG: methionine ABC transporter ATP-binding protein [Treponema sp.]
MQIELKHLVKTYANAGGAERVAAVKDVSLSIPSNKIYGIIGKSGAGKSSLVRLVSLLEGPDAGEVFYGGERVDNLTERELRARRRRIGMIFQNFNLFSSRTAAENIAYPLEICGVAKTEIRSRVGEMLELVGLADRASAPVSTLSGGQKQRIAIARALAPKPDVLFCDEATSALDPQTTKSILDLIRTIQAQMNLTVVMITHQMEVVRDACSLVAILNEGQVIECGAVSEIFVNPKSPVTRNFIANIAGNDNDGEKLVRWSDGGGEFTLRFDDDATDVPAISRLCKNFNVEVNIRAGGIQKLPDCKVGTLLADITGEKTEVEKALAYLNELGVRVERGGS